MRPLRPLLLLDTASPVVSVALGGNGRVLGQRTIELRRSSETLLSAIAAVLEEGGLTLAELAGVAVLQGPGSFTGLRIGLATVLGFHQALGLRATALPTHPILAAAAPVGPNDVVAVVDAIRGEWSTQRFRVDGGATRPMPLGGTELLADAELLALAPCRLVGFGIGRLAVEPGWPASGLEMLEPPPLAGVAARILSERTIAWDPRRLTAPLYFREPAVTRPAGPIA